MITDSSKRIAVFRVLVEIAKAILDNQTNVKTEYEIFRIRMDVTTAPPKASRLDPRMSFNKIITAHNETITKERLSYSERRLNEINLGKWSRILPLGFCRNQQGGIEYDENAKVIYLIFLLFLETKSISKTQRMLGNLKFHINESRVMYVLKSSVYCGYILIDNSQIIVSHVLKPIVSVETFEEVQSIINKRTRSVKPIQESKHLFPLNGFVRDLNSNINFQGYRAFKRKSKQQFYYYKVQFPQKPINVRAEWLHNEFCDYLHKTFSSFDGDFRSVLREYHEILEACLERYENDLEEEYITASRVRQAGDYNLQNQNRHLINGIELLLKEINFFSNGDNFIAFGTNVFENIGTMWKDADYEAKRNLQWLIFPKGIYLNETKRFQYLELLGSEFMKSHEV